eukprot:4341688-Pyramimonas_sp.AAC.1
MRPQKGERWKDGRPRVHAALAQASRPAASCASGFPACSCCRSSPAGRSTAPLPSGRRCVFEGR